MNEFKWEEPSAVVHIYNPSYLDHLSPEVQDHPRQYSKYWDSF
jgi:hypothetical protein